MGVMGIREIAMEAFRAWANLCLIHERRTVKWLPAAGAPAYAAGLDHSGRISRQYAGAPVSIVPNILLAFRAGGGRFLRT